MVVTVLSLKGEEKREEECEGGWKRGSGREKKKRGTGRGRGRRKEEGKGERKRESVLMSSYPQSIQIENLFNQRIYSIKESIELGLKLLCPSEVSRQYSDSSRETTASTNPLTKKTCHLESKRYLPKLKFA